MRKRFCYITNQGFTLAEVLITLGIIGVVAAMTMPSLIAEHREKAAVARLKKVYSTLENAYMLARNENMDISSWFPDDDIKNNSRIFFENLKPYLNILKDCGVESGCITEGYVKTLDGRNYHNYDQNTKEYKFIMSDGTQVIIYLATSNYAGSEAIGNIKVDIDGYKGSYTFGKDFFIFNITPKGIYPNGLENTTATDTFEDACNKSKSTTANGTSCTAWVIFNENMDYLHCNDLSWDGKTKCK